jgi:D-lactate dehydrogenase
MVALFDAKSYDIASFEGRNDGRFAIDPIEASLSEATAPAAEGHKVVCIFVNDTCDAKVVKALAALGVELVALRCAGFNNVDLAACRELGLSVVRVKYCHTRWPSTRWG